MASSTQWTWFWVDSGSGWWTGKPGLVQFMGSQRVGHEWATELTLQSLNCQKLHSPDFPAAWFGARDFSPPIRGILLKTVRQVGKKMVVSGWSSGWSRVRGAVTQADRGLVPHLWQSPQPQGQGLLLYFGLGGLHGGLTGDLLTLVLY